MLNPPHLQLPTTVSFRPFSQALERPHSLPNPETTTVSPGFNPGRIPSSTKGTPREKETAEGPVKTIHCETDRLCSLEILAFGGGPDETIDAFLLW